MHDLAKIYYPGVPFGDSFKKATNKFKKCIISDCSSFNFTNQELINNFDTEIKNNYSSKLEQMKALLNHFFDLKNEPVLNKLVRSILELIEKDDTISKNDKFYILPNGKAVSKVAMLLSDTFDLPAFILGVFHYIIVNKIDNKLGLQTYESWYVSSGNKKIYKFTSDIGDNYKAITLTIDATAVETANEEIEPEQEQETSDGILYETNSDKSTNDNQTINVNYQFGHNNFNNIGSLTFIDKD